MWARGIGKKRKEKKKKQRQIQDIADGYVVKDGIETGYGNIIPLWMFGMLY